MNPNQNYKTESSVKKHWLNFSNISTFVLAVLLLAMIVNPNIKAFVIQGLMKVGFFQPDVPVNSSGKDKNNKVIPEAVFVDGDHNTIKLSDLRGKVIFLNFWATWCPPCIAEMPSVNKLYQRYKTKNDIVFLMIDADGNYAKAKTFMDKKGFDLPVYTQASEIPESLFGNSLPTAVIINPEGQIVFRHEGGADYANPKFFDFIDQLLLKK